MTLADWTAVRRPGDTYAQAFMVEPMKCWRMVHDHKGQATHCHQELTWTGQPAHADGRHFASNPARDL